MPKRITRSLRPGFLFLLLFLLLPGCTRSTVKPVSEPTGEKPPPVQVPSETPEAVQTQPPPPFEAVLKERTVTLRVPSSKWKVWRDYQQFDGDFPRAGRVSLTVQKGRAEDRGVPQGVTLFYQARGPDGTTESASLTTPGKELPELFSPVITVDKSRYTLEVWDKGSLVKTYPVALGSEPKNRKFCQDMASTPEGWYQIYNLQPRATYYKAFDIDYPRPIDTVRRRLAIETGRIAPDRPIGGEIQIHGKGIGWNWTAGCIAMRDEDMDELFARPAIGVDTSVYIYGQQFSRADMDWLRSPPKSAVKKVQKTLTQHGLYRGALDGLLGTGTAYALGKYQQANGLPDSCQLDSVTRAHFGI